MDLINGEASMKTSHHEIPERIRGELSQQADLVLVMDNIQVGFLIKLTAGLGPKFIFPLKPSETDDRLGLAIAAQQIENLHNFTHQHDRTEYQNSIKSAFKEHEMVMIKQPNDDREWKKSLTPINRLLHLAHETTKTFLKDNQDIMIMQSDKGKRPIICKVSTYKSKLEEVLEKGVNNGTYTLHTHSTLQAKAKLIQITKRAEREYETMRLNINFYLFGGKRVASKNDLLSHNRPRTLSRIHTVIKNDIISTPGHSKLGLATLEAGQLKQDIYTLPKMKITIKTHKGEHYPARPIIAAPGSMGKPLEEYLHKLLKIYITPFDTHTSNTHKTWIDPDKVTTEEWINNKAHIVREYGEVARHVQNTTIPTDHHLYTLDHVEMYTNVKLEMAIEIIERDFDRLLAERTAMPKEMFIDCINMIMEHNSYFSANEQIYQQSKGLTMGGKLSYILAEIVTTDGLKKAITQATKEGARISLIHKYVDDVLLAMNGENYNTKGKKHIDNLLTLITENLGGMPTTVENESDGIYDNGVNGGVTYLNMRIFRDKQLTISNTQKLTSIWYRPSYHTNRLINQLSHQHENVKTSTIRELISNALRATSDHMIPLIAHPLQDIVRGNGYSDHSFKNALMYACRKLGKSHLPLVTALTKKRGETLITNYNTHTSRNTQAHKANNINSYDNYTNTGYTNPNNISNQTQNQPQGLRRWEKCRKCGKKFRLTRGTHHTCTNTQYTQSDINQDNNIVGLKEPTKNSMFIPKASEHWRIRATNTPQITHIQSPYIPGLTESIATTNKNHGVNITPAAPAKRSKIFEIPKIKTDTLDTRNCTFTVPCNTCNTNIINNSGMGSILNGQKQTYYKHTLPLNIDHDSASTGQNQNQKHDLNWAETKVIRTYRTANKAAIGLELIKSMAEGKRNDLGDFTINTNWNSTL